MVKSLGHQTSVSWGRVDGEWIYRVNVSEGDSALHNLVVTQELSQVMLLPHDVEELDSQPIGEMVNGIFSMIVKVSLLLLFISSKYWPRSPSTYVLCFSM